MLSCKEKNKDIAEKKTWMITYTLTHHEDRWGYKIFIDGQLSINQDIIPDVDGYHYFKTAKEAESVALLVINRLEHNIFPPSVSKHELDSLGVNYE
jgi:hypothetical protein